MSEPPVPAPEHAENPVMHVGQHLGVAVLIIVGGVVVEYAKQTFHGLPGPVIVMLNLLDLALAISLVTSLVQAAVAMVESFGELGRVLGSLGPGRFVARFVRSLVPSGEEFTSAVIYGVGSGFSLLVFVGLALVTANAPVLIVVGAALCLFVGVGLWRSRQQDEVDDSFSAAALVVLLGLGLLVCVGVPVLLAGSLWLTGTVKPVTDFVVQALHTR